MAGTSRHKHGSGSVSRASVIRNPVTDDLTIDGPSSGKVRISGNDASRVFNISGADTEVTIDDLTLVRDHAEDAGGAILHTGQTLSVTNIEFNHNQVIGNEEVILLSWSSELICPIWVGRLADPTTRKGCKESLD